MYFYAFLFILGSAIGSFLNVVICRLKVAENRSRGIYRERFSAKLGRFTGNRSHCVKCGQVLAWYDLIPIISFFILRGRCRTCQEKISWQYPLVEAATGLLFIASILFLFPELVEGSGFLAFDFASLRSGNIIEMFYFFYLISSLIVIFVYDLRHYIIPDKVLWPAVIVSLAYRLWDAFFNPSLVLPLSRGGKGWGELWRQAISHWPSAISGFYPYLLAALAAAAFFMFLVLITRGRGMGLGDVKLALLMGLVLGWPSILVALFLAFCLGALTGVILIAVGRKTLKSQIPFGPFLIAGTLAVLFWGQQISGFYLGLFA